MNADSDDAIESESKQGASRLSQAIASWRETTLSPLRYRAFKTLWIASFATALGSVIQMVSASWAMAEASGSADMVAFVQTAALLPIMLLSLPAGALADSGHQKKMMMFAQILGFLAAGALAVFAAFGSVDPYALLAFTFLIGCAIAIHQPAWQSSFLILVPREALTAAVGLNAVAFNVARSIGPAVGGLIIASIGVFVAFSFNAATFLIFISVLALWKQDKEKKSKIPPESIGEAMIFGIRYLGLSPSLTAILIRGGLFGLSASAVTALTPLIVRDQLGGDSFVYGLILGCFGVGSILGAGILAYLREHHKNETIVAVAIFVYAVASVVLGLSTSQVVSAIAMIAAGAAWILAMAIMTTCVQLSSPRWILGRALAFSRIANIGGAAIGALVWGLIAKEIGVASTVIWSGVVMAATLIGSRTVPLPARTDFKAPAPPPTDLEQPKVEIDTHQGPIIITREYRVQAKDAGAFLSAIYKLSAELRRSGARRYDIAQDLDSPEIWIERVEWANWIELLRHRTRNTTEGQKIRAAVLSFQSGGEPKIQRSISRPRGAQPLARSTDPERGETGHAASTDGGEPDA